MTIHFNHTAENARQYRQQILAAVGKVIDSGIFLNGRQNQLLAQNLQKMLGARYVTPVASGHDALMLTLNCLHLQANDEIIIPANVYPTAFAVYQTKAKVVLADVDEQGQLSLAEIQKQVSPRTKAVVVVHLYGLVGEIGEIAAWLKKQQIVLIEDCAQATGTRYQGQAVGTFGQFGCFSFYPTKNLGTLGDGGAIVTNQNKYWQYLNQAKSYGEKAKNQSQFISGHSRLPEIQAAILNVYCQHFETSQKQRQKLAIYFCQQIKKQQLELFVRPLYDESVTRNLISPHLFVIRVQQRDQLKQFLAAHDIPTSIHFPLSIHQVPAFANFLPKNLHFSVSEKLSQEVLSLPFHQFLTKKQIDEIVRLIHQFYFSQLPLINSLTMMYPAYNDAFAISELVAKADQIGQIIAKNYQILVVNDGSTDKTKQILQQLTKRYSHLNVINHPQNRGYGAALTTGFGAAHTDWFFYTDGDGQYDPNQITNLLQELKRHPQLDVVNGYIQERHDRWQRLICGYLYNWFLHLVFRLPIRDIDCDFRLIKVSKLHQLQLKSHSGAICLELVSQLAKNKADFMEVPVAHLQRKYGESQFFHPKHITQTFYELALYFFRFYFRIFLLYHPKQPIKPRSSNC